MIEPLEIRRLLAGAAGAGTVWVKYVNDTLYIRGDGEANEITITREGRFTKVASDPAGGSSTITHINGTHLSRKFANVTGSLNIRLGGGANRLRIHDLDLNGGVYIDSLNEADLVAIDGSSFGGGVKIITHGGTDRVNLTDVRIGGATVIRTGNGQDIIGLNQTTFDGDVLVKAGNGRDTVSYAGSVFNAAVRLNGDRGSDLLSDKSVSVKADFRNGLENWTPDIADYWPPPHGGFEKGLSPLPPELGVSGTGLRMSSQNGTDDAFMFLKRGLGRADGLKPLQQYQLTFRITFASNAAPGLLGAGGAPGESVWLKAGADGFEPKVFVDDQNFTRLNIEKGLGPNSFTSSISNIANGLIPDPDLPLLYQSIERTHVHTRVVSTDAQGRLWLIVGTDSGFEGITTLYYQSIDVTLVPVRQTVPAAA